MTEIQYRIRYHARDSHEENWQLHEVIVTGADNAEQTRKELSERINTRNVRVNAIHYEI